MASLYNMVCSLILHTSLTDHSQMMKGAFPILCMNEQKHPMLVLRRYSFGYTGLGKVASVIKEHSLKALLRHSALKVCSTHHATLLFYS